MGALVIAVVAFLIAKPGSDSGNDKASTQAANPGKGAKPAEPAGPKRFRIALKGHSPVGGRQTIKVTKGDRALIVVTSDGADKVHLHGWDIERDVTPAKPGRFGFRADREGAYELESHTTEQKVAHDSGSSRMINWLIAHGLIVRSDLPIPEWLFALGRGDGAAPVLCGAGGALAGAQAAGGALAPAPRWRGQGAGQPRRSRS